MIALSFFDIFALSAIALAVSFAVAFAWDSEHIGARRAAPVRGGFRVERYVIAPQTGEGAFTLRRE